MTAWSAHGMDKPTFNEAMSGLNGDQAKTIKKGHIFGPSWSNHWVQVEMRIPDDFRKAGQQVLCMFYVSLASLCARVQESHSPSFTVDFDSSSEGLIFTQDGKALHGQYPCVNRILY